MAPRIQNLSGRRDDNGVVGRSGKQLWRIARFKMLTVKRLELGGRRYRQKLTLKEVHHRAEKMTAMRASDNAPLCYMSAARGDVAGSVGVKKYATDTNSDGCQCDCGIQ